MKHFSRHESILSILSKWALRLSLIFRPVAFGKKRINLRLLLIYPRNWRTTVQPEVFQGVTGEWIRPRNAKPGRYLIYFHGGGYTGGSARTHRALASHIANAADTSAFSVNYRLAPEHPFPAALDDAFAVWQAFREFAEPSQIVLAGDSAGGGLALALAYKIREARDASPAGIALLAPWVDVRMIHPDSPSYQAKDPMLKLEELRRYGKLYAGEKATDNHFISPVEGPLEVLPPLLIQAGTADILYPDIAAFAAKAETAGVKVEFEVWENMMHVWHAALLIQESAEAIWRLGDWINQRFQTDKKTPDHQLR